MSAIDLHILLRKLDTDASASLERAAGLAVRNAHETIELAHWLAEIAAAPSFAPLAGRAGGNADAIRVEAARAVEALGRGRAAGAPSFAQGTILLAREAWVTASLQFGAARVGVGHLLAALLRDTTLRSAARGLVPSLRDLDLAALEKAVAEAGEPAGAEAQAARAERGAAATLGGAEEFLRDYTTDLTAEARGGRLDPVIGRERELRQVVDILMRRRQNNPILVGEAGVGKTAIVEAFALKIAAGEVPERLRDVRLLVLDVARLQAGAGVKGEFERRLKGVVDEVKRSPEPVILFIDEAHTIVGAGSGPGGASDAANILKPSLARGELRTIAATTWSEYKRHIEKDPALTRRFQTVKVNEPDIETAIRMMRGLSAGFADHHGVRIREAALRAAVELSARYIPSRQLPDKAVSVLDTAAATVALSRQTEPPSLDDARREVELLVAERDGLAAEPETPAIVERLEAIARDLVAAEAEAADLDARRNAEAALVDRADALEARLGEGADVATELAAVEGELAQLQGEAPLIGRVVDREAVAQLVARWTGVPVGRVLRDEVSAVRTLEERLGERVIGQDGALRTIAAAMRTARANLADPRRPPAVFLLVGTSGVGKTETALALADLIYGGDSHLTVINMSEFKEEHKVSLLLGSPPGYVGYGEGGVLTEAVRRRPYGVLLLDEIDKAHPGVQDVFYQLFDKGTLRDGEGRDIDFKNTVILMTANTGSETLARLAADPDTMPEGEALERALNAELLAAFKPAFVGRTVVVPYLPLGLDTLRGIVDLQLRKIAARVTASHGARLDVADAARTLLVAGARESEKGARAIEARLSRDLLPLLSSVFLDAIADGVRLAAVTVDAENDALVVRPERAIHAAPPPAPPATKSGRLDATEEAA